MLYVVYTGWMGNGREAVIVEAPNVSAARVEASRTMTASLREMEERINPHRRPALEDYSTFEVVELGLPHICEMD